MGIASRLLVLAASAAVLLSGCAVAEQTRDMTPAEKVAAVQIAEAAGFASLYFASEHQDLFGGNYKEYVVAQQPSGTDNPYSPLVGQYRDLLDAYTNSHTFGVARDDIVYCRKVPGSPTSTSSTTVVELCGFTLVSNVEVDGGVQTLSIGVSATSEGVSRISVSPYYAHTPLYPAPTTIPDTYQGDAQ